MKHQLNKPVKELTEMNVVYWNVMNKIQGSRDFLCILTSSLSAKPQNI